MTITVTVTDADGVHVLSVDVPNVPREEITLPGRTTPDIHGVLAIVGHRLSIDSKKQIST